MTQQERYITFLENSWKNGSLYFVLASFISADLNTCDRPGALKELRRFNRYLKPTNIDERQKQHIKTFLLDGIKILKNELKEDDKRRLHASP